MEKTSVLLAKAVQHLYGTGDIKKDKDIADKTGYNKATVSSYITGKIPPSAGFLDAFQKVFDVRIEDFETGGSRETIKHPDALQLLSENMLLIKAELQTNRQLMIEVLAAVTSRSVTEVQLISDKILQHNLEKVVSELRQGTV